MTWFPGQVAAVGRGNQLGVGEDCVVGRSEGRGGADERDVVGIEPATGAIARRAHDLASRHLAQPMPKLRTSTTEGDEDGLSGGSLATADGQGM